MQGWYGVVEGIDGAGKTTQMPRLSQELRSKHDLLEVREPGGTEFGEEVRRLVLHSFDMSAESEFDLFTVSRRELGRIAIKPHLEDGGVVLSDRSWISSVAYQGFGRGLDPEKIIDRSQEVMGELFIPDKVALLHVPLDVSLERTGFRAEAADRIEAEGIEFKRRVIEGYEWVAERFNFVVIDAVPSEEEVYEDFRAVFVDDEN